MGLGHYLVEAHLREGRSVAELARTHGIHRSWLYKLLARIDRLPPESKRTLRVAAVIGRQFGVAMLERLLEAKTE